MSWLFPLPYPFVHPFAISALWFVAFGVYGRIKARCTQENRSTLFEDLKVPAMVQLYLLALTFTVMAPCSAGNRHCEVPHGEWWPFTPAYTDGVYILSNFVLWVGVLYGAFYVLRRVVNFFIRKVS